MHKGIAVLVLDYSSDDMARDEVFLKTKRRLFPYGWDTMTSSVPGMCTLSGGLKFAQLALDPDDHSGNTIFLVNVAPRKDLKSARPNNHGEELVYVKLDNGVEALVVNSGYSLSFVKEHIVEAKNVNVARSGSQFRSRDFFPEALRKLAIGDASLFNGDIDLSDSIPDIPKRVILYIDNFGNLKTSIRANSPEAQQLVEGEQVLLRIARSGVAIPAYVSAGNFNVRDGATAFGPGSSGQSNRFFEIFVRGGSAERSLNYPSVGDEFVIEKVA